MKGMFCLKSFVEFCLFTGNSHFIKMKQETFERNPIAGKMEKYEWLDEFQHIIPVLNFPWMFGQPKWFCNREQRKFLHGNFLLSHWPARGNIDYLSGINIYFLESKNENQLPSRAVLHIVGIYIGNGLKTVTINSWSWRQLL